MDNELYVIGESKPRKRYFVLDEHRDGEGDSFGEAFFSLDDAIAEADRSWRYLTAREKKARHIIVGYIDPKFVPDNVLGERSIIGDADPDDWDAEADDTWCFNFSCYDTVYECADEEA